MKQQNENIADAAKLSTDELQKIHDYVNSEAETTVELKAKIEICQVYIEAIDGKISEHKKALRPRSKKDANDLLNGRDAQSLTADEKLSRKEHRDKLKVDRNKFVRSEKTLTIKLKKISSANSLAHNITMARDNGHDETYVRRYTAQALRRLSNVALRVKDKPTLAAALVELKKSADNGDRAQFNSACTEFLKTYDVLFYYRISGIERYRNGFYDAFCEGLVKWNTDDGFSALDIPIKETTQAMLDNATVVLSGLEGEEEAQDSSSKTSSGGSDDASEQSDSSDETNPVFS